MRLVRPRRRRAQPSWSKARLLARSWSLQPRPITREAYLTLVSTPTHGPLAVANLAVSPEEAAALLSISRKAFDKHVLPAISSVRVGRRRIIRVATLEAEPAHGAGT